MVNGPLAVSRVSSSTLRSRSCLLTLFLVRGRTAITVRRPFDAADYRHAEHTQRGQSHSHGQELPWSVRKECYASSWCLPKNVCGFAAKLSFKRDDSLDESELKLDE